MRDGVGIDRARAPRPGMNIADLAAEQAELLPERVTLAAIEYNRQWFNPWNYPINSPGSNNFSIDSRAVPQIVDGNGSFVQTTSSSQIFINQGSGWW